MAAGSAMVQTVLKLGHQVRGGATLLVEHWRKACHNIRRDAWCGLGKLGPHPLTDSARQAVDAEWLGEMVVHSGVAAGGDVAGIGVGRKPDDRNLARTRAELTNPARRGKAVELGKLDIP